MRFHIGLSMNLKRVIKYLIPVAMVFFGTMFFNTQMVYALNYEIPSNCQNGSVTDTISCSAFTDYYEIPSTSTSCNVFLGDNDTGNLRTRQVEYFINYYGPYMSLTSTSNVNKGIDQNNLAVRFSREEDKDYFLSFDLKNSNSLACQTINGRNCAPPGFKVFYCPDSTYTNCLIQVVDYYSYETTTCNMSGDTCFKGLTYETLENNTTIMSTGVRNFKIPKSSSIYNNSQNRDLNYIQINFSTSYQDNQAWTTNVGATWIYDNVLLTDEEIDWSLTENDLTQKALNYCPGVSTGDFSMGGGDSVLDDITSSIADIMDNINNFYGDNNSTNNTIISGLNLSNYMGGFFGVEPATPLGVMITLPIALLEEIVDNSSTCTPYSFNLTDFTTAFGGQPYILTLPCIRSTMQEYFGTWYGIFDFLIASILFYYFSSNLVLKINDVLSGADIMPFFFQSSDPKRTTRPIHIHIDNLTGEVK